MHRLGLRYVGHIGLQSVNQEGDSPSPFLDMLPTQKKASWQGIHLGLYWTLVSSFAIIRLLETIGVYLIDIKQIRPYGF